MNISYEAYRVFYYTAKTRSFTQAANALGNSQPNITRIIKNLERELGCTLFLRNNRHVELTAEGETLYRHVSAAFEQLQAGEEALLRGGGLDGGILRIAATEIALHVFLLPVLSRFRGRYPGVHIRLFNGSTPAAIDELKNGLADLAFVTSPIDMTDKLRSTPLTEVQEIAVCGSAYRSLTGSPVTLEALAEYPAYYEETYGESLDEEIYNIMAIPDEERERCEIYVNLPQETLKFYDKLWTQLGV